MSVLTGMENQFIYLLILRKGKEKTKMNKDRCKFCMQEADYVIQWDPQSGQKGFACEDHIRKLLAATKAPEMWVIKVKKT